MLLSGLLQFLGRSLQLNSSLSFFYISFLFQYNIEPCPECGNMKLKHTLCGFCFEKVRKETAMIRKQISIMDGGPLNAPAVESVVLYENENPSEADKDKRIIERNRKRPYWFNM
uniref:Mitochondrial ribosomal protein L32 n=1 Tax=Sinocyclocheilus grahami TaxID=75366 RepID=A0A672SWP9_SINGR